MAKSFQKDTNGTLLTGLVSYFKCEDTTDFYGSNNLTNNGGATFGAGKVNNGVIFSGSNNLNGNPFSTIWGTNTASIAFWLKDTQNTSVRRYMGGINGGAAGLMIEYNGNSANQLGFVKQGGTSLYVSENPGNTWTHYAFVADGTGTRIYKNGNSTPIASNADTGNFLNPSTTNFGIGAVYNGASPVNNVDCSMDEVGFWSKALSTTEISDLYNSGNGQTMTDATNTTNFFNFF